MSHVCDVKVEINDLDALASAAEALGCELVRGQQKFKWYGRHVGDYPLPEGFTVEDMGHCEHAIRFKGKAGAYEVGVVARRGGGKGFTLLYDHYAGGHGMSAAVGGKCERLVQRYAAERVKRVARRTHRVTEQKLPDGSIKMTLTRH